MDHRVKHAVIASPKLLVLLVSTCVVALLVLMSFSWGDDNGDGDGIGGNGIAIN